MTTIASSLTWESVVKESVLPTTQDVVPQLIEQLCNAKLEVLQNSNGPPLTYERDPHLRLRRTMTPRSKVTGIQKYSEAQFVIHPTTGRRQTLQFDALGHTFLMDAYVWGASEGDATIRMVALHGISPTASRERWHNLGTRIADDAVLSKCVQFVSLDWHSIDRGDAYQEAFLTMLPKHMFSVPPPDVAEDVLAMFPDDDPDDSRSKARSLFGHCQENCPRGFDEAAEVFKAVIQQGLGWGTSARTPFIPCMKSWSGGVGMEMLIQAAQEAANTDGGDDDDAATFRDSIQGAIIMHPGCFKGAGEIAGAMAIVPAALVAWARDDHLVPYPLSQRFMVHDGVKLVSYDYGRHGSFDGSDPNEPNFDDDIIAWVKETYLA